MQLLGYVSQYVADALARTHYIIWRSQGVGMSTSVIASTRICRNIQERLLEYTQGFKPVTNGMTSAGRIADDCDGVS